MAAVQDSLQNKDDNSNTLQMELKSELESLSESTRRQSIENLTLMKGLTKTMQVLKENDVFFKENDINTKKILSNMVEYFNSVNKILNHKSTDDEAIVSDVMSIEGKKAISSSVVNSVSKGIF